MIETGKHLLQQQIFCEDYKGIGWIESFVKRATYLTEL